MANTKDWRDVTSYSRGERERKVPPSSFELEVGKLKLVVTRHIHHDPTDWVMRMEGVFEAVLRGDKPAEFAQQSCLLLALNHLQTSMLAVTKALDAGTSNGRDKAEPPK